MTQGSLFDAQPPARHRRLAQECRLAGQIEGSKHKRTLYLQMLGYYTLEPRTDAELAHLLGVERSTINARRNELPQIVAVGTRKNPLSGVVNTVWGLR